MKLSGSQFQPWDSFDLEIEGLTVLVGPSNRGKSALFRALKGILRNDLPDNYVRNGQEEPMSVTLNVEGHSIEATRKRGGTVKYVVDGKKFSSLGGKTPEELKDLGFGDIKIGEYTIDPIFSSQNKAQFLIDSDRWKGTELNAIIGSFSNTEKLDSGKKEANLRISQRKSEASTLASEIRSAEERTTKILEINGETILIREIVSELEKGIRADELILGQVGSYLYHQARLRPLQAILDTLEVPSLDDISVLFTKANYAEQAGDSFLYSRFLKKLEIALSQLAEDWSSLKIVYKQKESFIEILSLREATEKSLKEYADGLLVVLNKIETQLTEAKTLDSSITQLTLAIFSKKAVNNLNSLITEEDKKLEEALEQVEDLRQELANHEAAEKAKQALCPKCGKTMEHVCQ